MISYHDLLDQSVEENADEMEQRERTLAPRDVKQISNLQERERTKSRIMRSEIFSLLEFQRNKTLGQFIRKFGVTENANEFVIMAEPAAVKMAQDLLNLASKSKKGSTHAQEQLLTYDTTFDIGPCFCSVLVARNTWMEGNPIFPVMFMLHHKKDVESHDEMWRSAKKIMNLSCIENNVPLCVDREAAIRKAVRNNYPEAKMVVCHNHLKRNVRT